MASPLHADGTPWPRAADVDGVAAARERANHERTYRDLHRHGRAKLVILGCETGGRWDPEVHGVLLGLALAKSRDAPRRLQKSAALAWGRRWINMLSVAAQAALAETLVAPGSNHLTEIDGDAPEIADLLLDDGPPAPSASRRPLR